MTTISISNAAAKAGLDAIVDLIDAGTGTATGLLNIYSGTPPADADASLSGNTLLATLTLTNPASGSASDAAPGALATFATITEDSSADANGTATFCRVVDRDGTVVIQGDVGTSSAFLIVASTSLVAGQPVQCSSMTLSLPETTS